MSLFILFLFVFLESLLVIWYLFPGTLVLIFFWALVGHGLYNFWIVFFVAFFANLLGSLINYFIWYKVGKRWLEKGFLFLKPAFFKRGYNFIKNHKGKFLILGKLIPWVKESITFVAWMLHLDFKKFLTFNSIWAALWAILYLGLGYLFYNSLNLAFIRLNRTEKFLLFLFLFDFVMFLLREFLYFFWKKIFILIKQIFYYFVNKLPQKYKNFIFQFSLSSIITLFLIFLSAYLFLSFVWFTSYLYHLDFVSHLDIAVSNLMFYYYDPSFEKLFLFISYFWNITTVLILSFMFLLFVKDNLRRTRLILGLVFIFLIVFVTKWVVARPRPDLSLIQELSYSFPSFHAGIAMFFYGFLALFLASKKSKWSDKINFIVYGLFFIVLIWLSRLYLNVHYLSDVIWGYWLWLIVLFITLLLKQAIKFSTFSKKVQTILVFIFTILLWINLCFYFKHFTYFSGRQNQTLHNIKSLTGQFNKNSQLKYTTTLFWRKTEPLNFIFLSPDKAELVKLFSLAGFYPAEKINLDRLKKLATAAYDGQTYKNAPMLPIFWNNKAQIFWFQKQEWNLKKRHHIRIWDTGWTYSGYHVYVGCAVFDDGIKWKITHKISPNIDKEREYFFHKFMDTGLVKKYLKIDFTAPIRNGKNFSYDKFFTDGKAYILWIK